MKKEIDDDYIDLLSENKKLIEDLEREENENERISTIDSEIIRIENAKNNTNIQKKRFISEIKNGLGSEIKSNPNKVTIIKKKWHEKFSSFFKKLVNVL